MIKVYDNTILSTPLTSKEIDKITKDNVQQAQQINAASEHLVASQFKEKENNFLAPSLRVPLEQKKNNQRINIKDDIKYKINVFSEQNENNNETLNFNEINKVNKRNKKLNILSEEKYLYNKKVEGKLNTYKNKSLLPIPSEPIKLENNKTSKDYDFLFLQLSYQNVIHQNVLNNIKDPDKLEYYLDKLDKLSKGIDGLKEQINSVLDEVKNTKNAYVDYWMEIYNQLKDNNFKTEAEVEKFLKNNNIPSSLIKELLSGNIKSKEDTEKLLEKAFPFMKLPDDLSKMSLDELDKLYGKLSDFFDEAFKYMPNVPISDDKINKITSHREELKALINKKENESIKEKLEQIKDTYRTLTLSQSALELEIMSDSLSGMALLTFLLAKTRELTLKVMLQRTESEQKLFEEMQEVTEKTLKDKIEDQKAQIKKQEEIQFWAGIGLKILGGLLALVAGIASIFTAGASMALMAVAVTLFVADVALTVADEVYQAIHDKSFMDEIMAPVSEAIMKAIDSIVDFLADVINSTIDGLKGLGLDKKMIEEMKNSIQEKLKMALKIAITVILFVAAMALSFVIGPAMKGMTNVANKIFNQQLRDTLKRILHDALESMMGKMIKEIIVQALEEVMEKINKQLTKDISQKAITMLNRTVVISKLVNSTATNAVNIYSSIISAKILQSMADSKKLEAILNLIQKLMDKIMESYHENIDTLTEILKSMSDKSSVSNKLKSDIIKNISI
ncbi:YopB/SseC family type III secretion system translocon subunit [Proteus sp. G2618]|uniref:type III secretion system translocon subunit SctE n=1 Tax=Proteus TaxID=583 RepID=UPI000D69CE09|nr:MULTISPECIES: type III secretion system translocon subunit SctE [Proteus]MCE9841634.1 type III secretion system translocon subunit SctE [Proteus terrae]NBN70483.1 YopB/SseC family type III secretion system translocon subunit [Proteus sp. G2618]